MQPRDIRINYLKIAVHIAAIAPLVWLLWAWFTDNLTINPIQGATLRTGKFALIYLVLTLAITPAHILTGYHPLISVRRMLGLYTFLYAAIHFIIFSWLDYGLDVQLIISEIINKRYTIVGAAALVILLALAVTSFRWWMKKLGKNWKRLHRLVYLAGLLVVLHYAWSKKGDIFRLAGDIWQPLLFGAIILVLLVMRLPRVRRWISSTSQRLRAAWRARADSKLSLRNS